MTSTDLATTPRPAAIAPALISDAEIDRTYRVAKALAMSNFFKDAKQAEQAFAKILLGRDLGLSPTQAMIGIHIVEGKPEMSANLQAQRVREYRGAEGQRYDYKVVEHTDKVCKLAFRRKEADGDWEDLGVETFTIEDAARAGLAGKQVWKAYTRNMLFARCLSNGVAFHCPEVMGGHRVYHEGEIETTAPAAAGAVGAQPATEVAPVAESAAAEAEPVDADVLLSDDERVELVQACAARGFEDMTMLLTSVGAESTDDLTAAQRDRILEKLLDAPAREPAAEPVPVEAKA